MRQSIVDGEGHFDPGVADVVNDVALFNCKQTLMTVFGSYVSYIVNSLYRFIVET